MTDLEGTKAQLFGRLHKRREYFHSPEPAVNIDAPPRICPFCQIEKTLSPQKIEHKETETTEKQILCFLGLLCCLALPEYSLARNNQIDEIALTNGLSSARPDADGSRVATVLWRRSG